MANKRSLIVAVVVSVAVILLSLEALSIPWSVSTSGQANHLTKVCVNENGNSQVAVASRNGTAPGSGVKWECLSLGDVVDLFSNDKVDSDCKGVTCKMYTRVMHSGAAIVAMGTFGLLFTIIGAVLTFITWKKDLDKPFPIIMFALAAFFSFLCLVIYKAAFGSFSITNGASTGFSLAWVIFGAQLLCVYLTFTGLDKSVPKKSLVAFVLLLLAFAFSITSLCVAWEGTATGAAPATAIDEDGEACFKNTEIHLAKYCEIYSSCDVDSPDCKLFDSEDDETECVDDDSPCHKYNEAGAATIAMGAIALICTFVALIVVALKQFLGKQIGPENLWFILLSLAMFFHLLEFIVYTGAFSQGLAETGGSFNVMAGVVCAFMIAVPLQLLAGIALHLSGGAAGSTTVAKKAEKPAPIGVTA